MSEPSSSDDRRDHARTPTLLVVNFRLAGRQAFLERYAENVSERGIFVVTTDVHPIGTAVHFELRTMDGAVALAGEGRIAWVRSANAVPGAAPGLGIAFTRLEGDGDALITQMVEAAKGLRKSDSPGGLSPGEASVQRWLNSIAAPVSRRRRWGWAAALLAALALAAGGAFVVGRSLGGSGEDEGEDPGPPLSPPVPLGDSNDAGP